MNSTKKPVVVIVDGYGAGRFFVQQLNNRGYACVHVQSTAQPMNQFFTLRNPENYLATFINDSDLTQLIAQISSQFQIDAVIPGTEPGVELAHQLAQKLNLKRNEDSLLPARRNKYAMVEALKQSHLKTVEHYKSNQLSQIQQWVKVHNQWPIVVKPLDSAGSDHVYICHNLEQIEQAFHRMINSKTIFARTCQEVLLQSYLKGEEYVVNMVSCEGQHFITEIRMYHKQDLNGKHIYDYEELLDFDGSLQSQLIDYAKQVADAVGIKYGPSHVEIMMTQEGPILVEIAARISGATHVDISNEALGYNVIDLTIDSYFAPEKFKQRLQQKPKVIKYENIIDVATEKQGYVTQLPSQQTITALPSVRSLRFNIKLGDYLQPTITLTNSPAKIHMVHQDQVQLKKDRETIKTLFQNDLKCEAKENVTT